MITETVKYTDYDDVEKTATFLFNLSRTRYLDNLDLDDQLAEIAEFFKGEERELTTVEKRAMVEFVKRLVRMSYGVRTPSGGFSQTDEVWTAFYESAAYDEFFMSLFVDMKKTYAFVLDIMPKNIREQAKDKVQEEYPDLVAQLEGENKSDPPQELMSVDEPKTEVGVTVEDDRPIWEKENRDPTKDEVRTATPEQLKALYLSKM